MATETVTPTWTVAVVSVDGFEVRALLREYMGEVVSRYRGRPATDHDVRLALDEFPDDDLRHPTGRFLLARMNGEAAGCIALRLGEPGAAYVVRMFVRPAFRRHGGGAALLEAAEAHARHLGVHTLRLEAGWDALYTDHFYERKL